MHRGPGGRGARTRREVAAGEWEVRARVERFIEPTLLQLLDRSSSKALPPPNKTAVVYPAPTPMAEKIPNEMILSRLAWGVGSS